MFLASMLGALRSLFKTNTYGSELEQYIVSHNPQNTCDVENLTREYEATMLSGRFL